MLISLIVSFFVFCKKFLIHQYWNVNSLFNVNIDLYNPINFNSQRKYKEYLKPIFEDIENKKADYKKILEQTKIAFNKLPDKNKTSLKLQDTLKITIAKYKNSIKILEEYTALYNINILDMASSEADDFVIALKNNKELAPNSVRLIVAGCSSFFTYLERSFMFIKNPFRGTKTRPKNTNKKNILIPTKKEIDFIISNIENKTLRAVIIFIKETGVRIGSLKSLEIKTSNKKYIYKAQSKCHDIKGIISTVAMSAIKKAKLNNTKPFEKINTEATRVTIYKNIKLMHTQKLVNAAYSVHDFRHYFAVENYKKDKDIYKLKNLLCHSSIAITERYLKSMDIDIGE